MNRFCVMARFSQRMVNHSGKVLLEFVYLRLCSAGGIGERLGFWDLDSIKLVISERHCGTEGGARENSDFYLPSS